MAIKVPVTKTVISTTDFGVPVVNQLNGLTPTAWTNVTFTNGWSNADASMPVMYRKVGDIVYVRGSAKSADGRNTVMFTLPSGFRAASVMQMATAAYVASTWQFAEYDILTDGGYRYNSASPVGPLYLPLTSSFSTTL